MPQPGLDPDTIEKILDRFALLGSARSIARAFGLDLAVVQKIGQDNRESIWKRRRSWRDWIAQGEPLASPFHQILFLAELARRAKDQQRFREATDAVKAIASVMNGEEKSYTDEIDLRIMEKIQKGDWEEALQAIKEEEAKLPQVLPLSNRAQDPRHPAGPWNRRKQELRGGE